MKIKKIKSGNLLKLLLVLVIIDILIFAAVLITPPIKTRQIEKRSEEIIYSPPFSPTPIASSPLPSPAPIPENWNYYTITNFHLSPEIANEYPKLAKGKLIFRYPNSWYINELRPVFSYEKKYGVFIGIDLRKEDPKYEKYSHGELPDPNSVFITFVVKQTSKTPNELVDKFYEEFGHASAIDQSQKNLKFAGYNAAMIRTLKPFPDDVIFSVDENTTIEIEIQFYSYDDKGEANRKYINDTVGEINQILSSVKFIKE